jgi:hypothetical protein
MNIKIKYKPFSYQKDIHKLCEDDTTKYITVVAGRQVGKSKSAIIQVIKWALSKKGLTIWVVSPSSSQASKFYKSLLGPLENAGLVKSATASKGDIKMELINNSLIEFKSILAKDTLRGQTLDYLILDEAAFMDEETVDQVLLPMILTKPKAKVLLTTTPKGKNWVYKWFNKAITDERYKSIRVRSFDNPLADKELIDGWRNSMPAKRFQQEILAEFIDAATVFENVSDLVHIPNGGKKFYAGIDIGMLHDNTVITVLNELGEVQYVDKFTNIPVQDIVTRLGETLKKYNITKAYIEANNQGLPIYQLLKPIHFNKIELFNTTATSKPEIINNLIAAFSLQTIKIIDDEVLMSELESFEEKYGPTGRVTFSAPSGMHDDTVMSLAIAWECLNKNLHSGVIPIEF